MEGFRFLEFVFETVDSSSLEIAGEDPFGEDLLRLRLGDAGALLFFDAATPLAC